MLCNKYTGILFLSAVVLLPAGCRTEFVEKVRAMGTEFSALTGPTIDVLEAVKLVSKQSAPFLKLTGPVGSLVAAGVEIVFPPESDTLKAIILLHNTLKLGFEQLLQAIEQLRTAIYGDSLVEYGNVVVSNLDAIDPLLLRITDADGAKRALWKQDFINACTNYQDSPLRTLQWMNRRLNTWCPLPQKKEAQIFAHLVTFFTELETRVLMYDDVPTVTVRYQKLKRRMIRHLTSMEEQIAKDYIEDFKKEILPTSDTTFDGLATMVHALHKAFSKIKKPSGELYPCLLKEAIETQEYQTPALMNFVDIVRRDIAHLQLAAGLCANLSTNGSVAKMTEILEEVNSLVHQITAKIEAWVPFKLAQAWPQVISAYAKRAYPRETTIDKYRYNRTALKILKEANNRGPLSYEHSVLITPSWDVQEWFYTSCAPTYNCYREPNFKDTHFIITRYGKLEVDRAQRALDWFLAKNANISAIIDQNWKADNLAWLLQQINQDIGGGVGSLVYMLISPFCATQN